MADRESHIKLVGRLATKYSMVVIVGVFTAGATSTVIQSTYATKADARDIAHSVVNENDHGSEKAIPESRAVAPPPNGMAAALKASERRQSAALARIETQSAKLDKVVDRFDRLVLFQLQRFVSGAAADAEPNRKKKAQSAKDAVTEFNRLVRVEHVEPDEAARQVLQTDPY